MSIGTIDSATFTEIANAIRHHTGGAEVYKPTEMAAAVKNLASTAANEGTQDVAGEPERGIISRSVFDAIALAIREQNGSETKYMPAEMAPAIRALSFAKARALMHTDGTIEFTYRSDSTSALSTPVSTVYEIDTAGYSLTERTPWYSARNSIIAAVFDESWEGCGITNFGYWFYGARNLVTVRGFEHVVGAVTVSAMFDTCDSLETIYATTFDGSTITSTRTVFSSCYKLVGGTGCAVPGSYGDASLLTTGAAGVLTNPNLDRRPWVNVYLYTDGEAVFSLGAPDSTRTLAASGRFCPAATYVSARFSPLYASRASVERVSFDDSLQGLTLPSGLSVHTNWWFNDYDGLLSVEGMGYVPAISTWKSTFESCDSLVSIDWTGMDTARFSEFASTFSGCDVLKTILVSDDFALPATTIDYYSVFYSCTSIEGGAGTLYDSGLDGASALRIDGGTAAPGYLTSVSQQTAAADPGLKLRALLLDDGTLEVNYLDGRQTTQSGRTISKAYDVDGAGYAEITSVPWENDIGLIQHVVLDSSLATAMAAGAGITNTDFWFVGCSNLVDVTGFENLQGITSAKQMFNSCSVLESIYATSFDNTGLSASMMFSGCVHLVGGTDGYVPTNSSNASVCKVGAGGVLTSPDADARNWYEVVLWSDGELVVGAESPLADDAREVLAHGRLCAEANYNASGVLPGYAQRAKITRVTIDYNISGFEVLNMNYLFYGLSALTTFAGAENLKCKTSMRYTFSGCTSLVELDFRGILIEPTDMFYCFNGCTALTTIYVLPGYDNPELTSGGTFYNCKSLVGGAGTKWSSDAITARYFRVDGGTSEPGYLTEKEWDY